MEQTIALEAATDPDHVKEDYMGLMNTNATSVESLSFFSLPGDLRNMIYDIVLGRESHGIWAETFPLHLALRRISFDTCPR